LIHFYKRYISNMAEEEGGVEGAQRPGADRRRTNPGSDISRLSQSGTSLYELLDIPKTSTDQEIKKRYRRLALKYHPDKNPNNAEAEEMFKKINQANSVLSDEKKTQNIRQVWFLRPLCC